MEQLDDWLKAGKIAGEAREYAKSIAKKGVLLKDLAEQIEQKIKDLGGQPAFPVNLSMDAFAAHDTPAPDDTRVLESQVLKIDIGVHVEGCIGDTAATVDLSGNHAKLVEASEKALAAAIEKVKADASLGEIGAAINDTVASFGFRPIRNLSGHGLEPFIVHAPPSIPNFDTKDSTKLERPMVIAIEPFATDGAGMIEDKGDPVIFSQVNTGSLRTQTSRLVLAHITDYAMMPFATRWLPFSKGQVALALRDLRLHNLLHPYPPLVDRANGMVSQAEHTLILTEDEVIVSTR
ncbi:MAG: type II methionyl aminopeptidase [Nanoarchaeota archaeon]